MRFMKEDKPMEVAYYLQKLYFLCPREGERFDRVLLMKHISLMVAIGVPNFLGLFGFAYKGYIDNVGSEWLETLMVLCLLIMFLSLSLSYIILGNKIKKLVERIERITSKAPEELVKTFIKINKATWIAYLGMMTLTISISLINVHVNQYCDNEVKTDKGYSCGLLNPAWFPFQFEDTGTRRIILLIAYDCGQIVFNPIVSVNVVVLTSIPNFLVVQMKHLRMDLADIKASNLDKFTRNLKYYVQRYSEITGCVRDMNHSLGYCYLLEYNLLTMLLAVSGYIAVKTINVTACSTLLGLFLVGMLLCDNGQSLKDEHEQLIRCISTIPWYKMNAKAKLNYSLLLGMVQCPIHVRIRFFGVINYECLLQIYRRAYTFVTFLVNTSED